MPLCAAPSCLAGLAYVSSHGLQVWLLHDDEHSAVPQANIHSTAVDGWTASNGVSQRGYHEPTGQQEGRQLTFMELWLIPQSVLALSHVRPHFIVGNNPIR